MSELQRSERLESIGHYRLIRKAEVGSTGIVYLAEDTRTGQSVGLKVFHEESNERMREHFRAEAEIAARLDHPGIPSFFEAGEHDGIRFIARQFVEGHSLSRKLHDWCPAGKPDETVIERLIDVFEQVARTLHAAHEDGVVHRFLNPKSILIPEEGAPMLVNFGVVQDDDQAGGLRNVEMMSVEYTAPEALDGWEGTDRRIDVYSLGLTLYYCLTLQVPFSSMAGSSRIQAILHQGLPDPRRWNSAISPALCGVLEAASSRDPHERYGTALEVAEDLRRLR